MEHFIPVQTIEHVHHMAIDPRHVDVKENGPKHNPHLTLIELNYQPRKSEHETGPSSGGVVRPRANIGVERCAPCFVLNAPQ